MFNMNFVLKGTAGLEGTPYAFLAPIVEFIYQAMVPIIVILLAVAAIYSIILGVNMAKAESAEKRDEAKKRIMNFIIGMAVIVVLIVIIYLLADNIEAIVGVIEEGSQTGTGN